MSVGGSTVCATLPVKLTTGGAILVTTFVLTGSIGRGCCGILFGSDCGAVVAAILMAPTPTPGCEGRRIAVVMAIFGDDRADAAMAPVGLICL